MQLLLQHRIHKQLGCHAAVTAASCIQTAGLPCSYYRYLKYRKKEQQGYRAAVVRVSCIHTYIHINIYAHTYIYYIKLLGHHGTVI